MKRVVSPGNVASLSPRESGRSPRRPPATSCRRPPRPSLSVGQLSARRSDRPAAHQPDGPPPPRAARPPVGMVGSSAISASVILQGRERVSERRVLRGFSCGGIRVGHCSPLTRGRRSRRGHLMATESVPRGLLMSLTTICSPRLRRGPAVHGSSTRLPGASTVPPHVLRHLK